MNSKLANNASPDKLLFCKKSLTKAREELAKLQAAFDPAVYAEMQQYFEVKKGEL